MRFKDLPERAIFVSADDDSTDGPFLRTINYPSFPVRISGRKIGEYVEFNDDDEVCICSWRHTNIKQDMSTRKGDACVSYDIEEKTGTNTTVSVRYDPNGTITIPTEEGEIMSEKAVNLKDLKNGDHFRYPETLRYGRDVPSDVYVVIQIGGHRYVVNIRSGNWWCENLMDTGVIKVGVDIKSTDAKPPQLLFGDLDIGEEFFAIHSGMYTDEKRMKITSRNGIRRFVVLGGCRKGGTYHTLNDCEVERIPTNS